MADDDLTPEGAEFLLSAIDGMGVPASFLARLPSDNDWTLVIKMHALLEVALNRYIMLALRDLRLSEIVDRMDTGDRQRGKLAFVKALGLLKPEFQNFISVYSELRNSLVHDVRNFEFSFAAWIEKMADADLKNLKKYVSAILAFKVEHEGNMIEPAVMLLKDPRHIMAVVPLAHYGFSSED